MRKRREKRRSRKTTADVSDDRLPDGIASASIAATSVAGTSQARGPNTGSPLMSVKSGASSSSAVGPSTAVTSGGGGVAVGGPVPLEGLTFSVGNPMMPGGSTGASGATDAHTSPVEGAASHSGADSGALVCLVAVIVAACCLCLCC